MEMISLPPEMFVSLVFNNRQCDYILIPENEATILKTFDPLEQHYVLTQDSLGWKLWSKFGWENEKTHRIYMYSLMQSRPKVMTATSTKTIREQIVEATINGNIEEVMRISKQLNESNK